MKHLRAALALTLFFVVLTGVAFPMVVWAVGRVTFPEQAGGSLIKDAHGNVVGSSLLGQSFTKPEYFHPRPSAAGAGYDAANSSGTNLGPTSDKLVNGIKDDPATKDVDESFSGFKDLARAYREENGLAADAVIPADAATRSASGLDPDISPANAELQVARVAKARGVSAESVRQVLAAKTSSRTFGIFGEPRVNVLELNLALDAHK
ncbi:MAG TPA: potassium-transporting ATPase subunit KdpC [Polyangiaceae bacterium]|jgi:K+-transporting ATPase ATPase C chain|nr:potassium-transporting ATPase subunit KdpC [Polyangiaceae bacterium]